MTRAMCIERQEQAGKGLLQKQQQETGGLLGMTLKTEAEFNTVVIDVLIHKGKLYYSEVEPPRGYMAKGSSKLFIYDLSTIQKK